MLRQLSALQTMHMPLDGAKYDNLSKLTVTGSDSLAFYLFELQQQKKPKDFSHFVFGIWTHTDVTKRSQITKFVIENESEKYSEISWIYERDFLFWITVPIAESVVLL